MSILQFSEYFQLIFDNSNVNNKQMPELFFSKLFRIIKFFFLNLLRKAVLKLKVFPTNRNSSAFLIHTSKSVSIFSQTFLKLIFFKFFIHYIFQTKKYYVHLHAQNSFFNLGKEHFNRHWKKHTEHGNTWKTER